MKQLFTRLFLVCLVFSLSKGFAQTKPQLTFTIVAYIEEQTANYFGGKTAIEDSITKQVQQVNAIFNANAAFNSTYNFTVTGFNYFKDNANEDSTFLINSGPQETNYNYRIVYNAFPVDPNKYKIAFYDTFQSIVFSYSESYGGNGNIFSRVMTKTLAHELGHARGAYDLYAANINGNQNLVNSNLGWNAPIPSIMNGLFTENGWDTYSTYMINKTASLYGANNFTPAQWSDIAVNAYPQTIGVSVALGNGFPVPNATVKFYGIPWFPASDFTLSPSSPTYTLTTDNGGLAKFVGSSQNPFDISSGWMQYHTFFVTVTYNNETKYAWMPFYEVCAAFANGQSAYYKNIFFNAVGYNETPLINLGPSGPLIGNAPMSTVFPIYAFDLDGSIASVKVYDNGTYVGDAGIDNNTKAYWFWTSTLSEGTHSFTAVATDDLGATVASSPLKVTVNPANVLPSVSISSPSDNATYTSPANFTISGNATDSDGSISKVELYASGDLIASFTSASFSYNWSNVAAGKYTITARAIDDKGGFSISTINVTVNPAVTCTASAWSPTVAYVAGNEVQYNGIRYHANWWNYNERPDTHNGGPGSGMPWTSLGTCNTRVGMISSTRAMDLYPNPALGYVNVTFDSQTDATMEVVVSDVMTNKVLSKGLNAVAGTNYINLDISSLQTGIYVITISNGNDKLVKQLVVTK